MASFVTKLEQSKMVVDINMAMFCLRTRILSDFRASQRASSRLNHSTTVLVERFMILHRQSSILLDDIISEITHLIPVPIVLFGLIFLP
jgi:hypothetical protein